MYSVYQDRERLEDDLYQEEEEDSDGSEANSEVEFHLYSQLHYSSNLGELEEQEGEEEQNHEREDTRQNRVTDGDRGLEEKTGIKALTPTNGSLQQHLKQKKKKEKKDKPKKKSDSKGQRLPSSLFEEVIVIDSGPDVISISDDESAEGDEGICALKGRGMQTSTPAQQDAQKRKRTPGVPVTVESSSSESDSEESESESESDSSDSDGLESWMILGQGNQFGDHSISLNLEGGSHSESDVDAEGETWLVSDKDKEAQIYNKRKGVRIAVQRVSNRYYTDKNVNCRNCNNFGHLSKNCPDPKKLPPCFLCGTPGHPARDCLKRHCNNCSLPGHLYDSCSENSYWNRHCHRCNMKGHYPDACPEIWRQYHLTACIRQRMFSGVHPTTSLINHYDTVEEISRRQHRIKIRAKELKKNGGFQSFSEALLTPGPPKKKRKISFHKTNHQSYHTPRHTPNNHNPRPSHLFFNDNDLSAATPKTKKFNKYKQQESIGNVKPWKPKRPVPTSRNPLPAAKPLFNEAEDFPRGGGMGENKKKRRKKKKMNHVPSAQPGGHTEKRSNPLFGSVGGKVHGPKAKQEKRKKRKNQAPATADKKTGAQMYPADDNLFFIKQRKGRR
uniref:Zinc finger CCHC domain-containing protein 7 n=1 Tax=Haplochromis burtoni TaxID=8153 RepID=A0A3Q2UVB6_HAPBU